MRNDHMDNIKKFKRIYFEGKIELTTSTMQVLSLSAPQQPIKAIAKINIPTTIKSVAGEK